MNSKNDPQLHCKIIYFSADRANLCGDPVEHAISKVRKHSVWAIKDAPVITVDRRSGFPDKLMRLKRQSAAANAVILRVLWAL